MSFDIKEFKGRGHKLKSMGINSGTTLCTCRLCSHQKDFCERYVIETMGTPFRGKKSVYNRLHRSEPWFCSDICLNMYIMRYML